MKSATILFDESGDLGWTFSAPYMQGGSSRFLSLFFLILPSCDTYKLRKPMKEIYTSRGIDFKKVELKGGQLYRHEKDRIIKAAESLLATNPDIRGRLINIDKEKVLPHLHRDPNLLYNYAVKLAIIDDIVQHQNVVLMPDPRTIRVGALSIRDYLQTEATYTRGSAAYIKLKEKPSNSELALQFTDCLVHWFWREHELGDDMGLHNLKPYIKIRNLFF